MSHRYERELAAALTACRSAAEVCRAVQSAIVPEALEKQDRSPVTVADFASQAAVCRVIGDAFPGDPIIGEEDAESLRSPENAVFMNRVVEVFAGSLEKATPDQICRWIDRGGASEYSTRFWTLDPIDGTKGFLRKEQYAISLALILEGRIELGVLACPNLTTAGDIEDSGGLLFSAVRGSGAWVRGLSSIDSRPRPVHVSATANAREARFCESVESGHSSHDDSVKIATRLGMTREPLRLDSQTKYAVVAHGAADIYLRLPTRKDYRERIWDHAGGVILVEEAGGRVSDVDGRPLDFSQGSTLAANRGAVVTNAALHDRVLAVVRDVLGGEAPTA